MSNQAASPSIHLSIRGMTCSACVARVERALRKVPGVADAQVNFATEVATVHPASGQPLPDEAGLLASIEKAGYTATIQSDDDLAEVAEPEGWWTLWAPAVLALSASVPLMLPMLWGDHHFWPAWFQFALATPVQFILGARFYKAGWSALKDRSGNMDQLVALGTTAAWGLSCWLWWQDATVHQGHAGHAGPMLYFESSAMVVALVLLGKTLEGRAKRQTTQAIRALQSLRPEVVHRLGPQGEVDVPLKLVLVGDVLRIKPGEQIPTDAVIQEGASHVDESMLTGEPLPVARHVGERVTGGSINGEGLLTVRVIAVGAQTMLAQIIESVVEAQAGKAPIQRLVDQVSAVFVPVVLVLALLTGLGWWAWGLPGEQALIRAVAVLVIACPCALGLATPAAIMAGTGVAARQGILIKDPQALEMAKAIQVVAFDKTGTLTEGRPRLLGLHPAGGGALGDDDLLAVAAAMQAGSEHPLARAVLQAVAQRTDAAVLAARAQARDTRSVGGRGLESVVSLSNGEGGDGGEGSPWRLASMPWMTSMALTPPVSDDLLAQVQAQAAKGATVTWLLQQVDAAQDAWQARAWLSFGDDLKPGAKDAVALLKAQGIYTVMISGDNWGAARAMAQAVGLDEVVAEVLPGQKADHVRALQRRGAVAMVGDGLNDAPALAAADVGMAMANPGGGTDVALHTAGITLMRGDPLLVPAALDIARQTSARIRQNLFWAFAYNVIGIPLAAMGGLNPMVAGAAMAMSSVSVLLNALRLTRWRPEAINSGTTVRSSTG